MFSHELRYLSRRRCFLLLQGESVLELCIWLYDNVSAQIIPLALLRTFRIRKCRRRSSSTETQTRTFFCRSIDEVMSGDKLFPDFLLASRLYSLVRLRYLDFTTVFGDWRFNNEIESPCKDVSMFLCQVLCQWEASLLQSSKFSRDESSVSFLHPKAAGVFRDYVSFEGTHCLIPWQQHKQQWHFDTIYLMSFG